MSLIIYAYILFNIFIEKAITEIREKVKLRLNRQRTIIKTVEFADGIVILELLFLN